MNVTVEQVKGLIESDMKNVRLFDMTKQINSELQIDDEIKSLTDNDTDWLHSVLPKFCLVSYEVEPNKTLIGLIVTLQGELIIKRIEEGHQYNADRPLAVAMTNAIYLHLHQNYEFTQVN